MAASCPVPEPGPVPAVRQDVLNYTPLPRSVTLARQRAARLLIEWGRPELAGDAAVLLTELATNAVLHGTVKGRLFRVHLTLIDTVLRIAVTDARGERAPRPRTPDPDDQFGRGLVIVEMLADSWGVAFHPIGKTIWCEVKSTRAK